ncbi:hypothetical protein [Pseudomonas sp. Z3-6]|uniref:hypothetical protein n=1 Tax=Pseudomonas sp. Z3-6 TaxID=2817411 RepID=UPI003DAA1D60
MIPEAFWKSWLAFWLMAGPLLLSFLGLVFNLYLSRRHLDVMMEALKNSRYIYLWGPAWRGRGWFGGVVLLSKIAGIVVWSKAHIRSGDADPVDIKNFPPHLKRLLAIDLVVMGIASIWIVAIGLLIQFK